MPSRTFPALLPALLALGLSGTACTGLPPAAASRADAAWMRDLDAYNIVWTTPSGKSADSMPLSGHNLGINAWVENGDLLMLMGGPNCMDENGMQVKLGLVRLRFDRPVFAKDFKQTLYLAQSEITVEGRTEAGDPVAVKLWCEAGKTVVHARVASASPVGITASYETWSTYQAQFKDGGIQWMRRLAEQNARRLHDMKAQGMADFAAAVPDPLSKLTCGGRLDAPGLVDAGAVAGKFNGMPTQGVAARTQDPVKSLDLTFTLRMEQDASAQVWEKTLAAEAQKAQGDLAQKRAAALAWWKGFWDRSHIAIAPTPGFKPEDDKPWQAARNYQLIRYTMAANDSGRAMTLFNGGIFPCDGNPDGRNWDGCQFMGQNQMLVYAPMLRAGDFDLLRVGGDFYRDRTEEARLHAKKFWGVDGLVFTEPFSIFGLDAIGTDANGRSAPGHLHYHYTSGMTFALMMLAHDAYVGETTPHYADAAFGIVSYYDQYYQKKLEKEIGKPLDQGGKLVIYPSDGCEPYHGCRNNLDVVAGLMALTRDLLATPEGVLTSDQRAYLEGFRKRIPEFKIEEKDGHKFYAAAQNKPEWIFHNGNMDFPQMYITFPFNIVSLGRSDMELVKNTWQFGAVSPGVQHQNQCWYQTAIHFARMGETKDAAKYTVAKLLHEGHRFPTFYHTYYAGHSGNFCHTPDMDHGGVAMTALQEMIMQTDGRRILLGAAWPAEWNAYFKLHAPYQTTVEGHVVGGKVVVDKVIPESRRKDIEIFPLK